MTSSDRRFLYVSGVTAGFLIYVYPLFLPTPLLEPDEALHAAISQEMLNRGDWFCPTIHGEPFRDKPILYFWVQMLSLSICGSTEFAVRLPGLVLALLAAVTTGMIACRLFDRQTAAFAVLIQMTMIGPLAIAQAATHDVALVPLTNLLLLSFREINQRSDTGGNVVALTIGAVCLVCLAILAKGLIGIAVVGLAWTGFLAVSHQLTGQSLPRYTLIIVAGAVMAAPWFVKMESRSDGYLYYYFIQRHILGFVTATQPHGDEPWYYYIPRLVAGAAPWGWFIIPYLRHLYLRRNQGNCVPPSVVFVMVWFVVGLLFLSAAHSKLVTYALPLFPAVAILCAVAWNLRTTGQLAESPRLVFDGMMIIGSILGLFTPFMVLTACQIILGTHWPLLTWTLAGLVAVVSALTLVVYQSGNCIRTVGLASIWVGLLTCLLMTWPLQQVAEVYFGSDRTDAGSAAPHLSGRSERRHCCSENMRVGCTRDTSQIADTRHDEFRRVTQRQVIADHQEHNIFNVARRPMSDGIQNTCSSL